MEAGYGRAPWPPVVVGGFRGLLRGLLYGLPSDGLLVPETGAAGDGGPSAEAAAFMSAEMFRRR